MATVAGPQPALIEARKVSKGYRTQAGIIPVLKDLDLSVPQGEMLAVCGASGVGKSTLLHVLGTLDRPDSGQVLLAGEDVFALGENALRGLRNRFVGFVFQMHHLLPEFTALENVMFPLLIGRQDARRAQERATQLLSDVRLGARLHHRPAALSGGEQQRVAVARALAQSPRLLLADEPTGNLDQDTGDRLHVLLRRLNQETGVTVIVVTHNDRLASACDRTLRLDGGQLRQA